MKQKSVGSLHGDLSTIAERVCKTTRDSMITVWVSDRAEVYADSRRDAADAVAMHCIVGIYSMGMTAGDIIEDLLEVRRERLSTGMLD